MRNPLPLRSRHRNKYVNPSWVSLFSRAKTKSRKLLKSISRPLAPPFLPRRTCSSKAINIDTKNRGKANQIPVQQMHNLFNTDITIIHIRRKKGFWCQYLAGSFAMPIAMVLRPEGTQMGTTRQEKSSCRNGLSFLRQPVISKYYTELYELQKNCKI